jgi:hypothetical protein
MTRLAGEFRCDLPLKAAVDACAEAIESLAWDIESVEPNHIVSYVVESRTKIEVVLRDLGHATELRIIGTDSDPDPPDEAALIAELDRARYAIEAYVDDAEEAPDTEAESAEEQMGRLQGGHELEALPPSPAAAPDADQRQSERPTLAAQRRRLQDRVRESGGTLTMPVLDLLAEFGMPNFSASAMDTIQALLMTAGMKTTPELDEVAAGDSVTLILAGNSHKEVLPNDRAALIPEDRRPTEDATPDRPTAGATPDRPTAHATPDTVSRPKTNRLAIASLALSMVWLLGAGSLLAILVGGVAQRQIDRSAGREGGRILATAGIILGAIGAVVTLAVIIATAGPSDS